jgi:hypothetical protein
MKHVTAVLTKNSNKPCYMYRSIYYWDIMTIVHIHFILSCLHILNIHITIIFSSNVISVEIIQRLIRINVYTLYDV